jgi:hypothetical protein
MKALVLTLGLRYMCTVGASCFLLMQVKWNHLYTQKRKLKGGINKDHNTKTS